MSSTYILTNFRMFGFQHTKNALSQFLFPSLTTKSPLLCLQSYHQSQSHRCLAMFSKKKITDETSTGTKIKDVIKVKEFFDEQAELSDRKSSHFINTVEDFKNIKRIKRFGYAEFVQAALLAMEEFGVERDLESYKALIRIFPPGAFIPSSKFSSGFYPHFIQQRAVVEILCQMEKYRIIPDKEIESHIIAAFTEWSEPWRKCARMTYWMTKFRGINPYPLPEVLPNDPIELAILAIKRMSRDPQAEISIHSSDQFLFNNDKETNVDDNDNDKTWIVYSQSETQIELIDEIADKINNYKENWRVSLDGPNNIWLDRYSVSYFVLYARDTSPKKDNMNEVEQFLREQHEINDVANIPLSNFGYMNEKEALEPMKSFNKQKDATILAICATGNSSQSSLMAFVRLLERTNSSLKKIPVIISNKDNIENIIDV